MSMLPYPKKISADAHGDDMLACDVDKSYGCSIVRKGQTAVDEQTTSWMLLLVPCYYDAQLIFDFRIKAL